MKKYIFEEVYEEYMTANNMTDIELYDSDILPHVYREIARRANIDITDKTDSQVYDLLEWFVPGFVDFDHDLAMKLCAFV